MVVWSLAKVVVAFVTVTSLRSMCKAAHHIRHKFCVCFVLFIGSFHLSLHHPPPPPSLKIHCFHHSLSIFVSFSLTLSHSLYSFATPPLPSKRSLFRCVVLFSFQWQSPVRNATRCKNNPRTHATRTGLFLLFVPVLNSTRLNRNRQILFCSFILPG